MSHRTRTAPCTLLRAFAVIDVNRPNLKLAAGEHIHPNYPNTSFSFNRNLPVNFYGPARIVGSLDISYSSHVTRMRDLEVEAGGVTLSYYGTNNPRPTLDIDRLVVTGGGISASGASMNVRNSRVTAASGGSCVGGTSGSTMTLANLDLEGGLFGVIIGQETAMTLTNSVLKNHSMKAINFVGTDATSFPPLASSVSFTTFYNTKLPCPTGAVIISSSNNIFLNQAAGAPADTVSGVSCRHYYSLISPQTTTPPGGPNNILGMDPKFVNAAGGDFHLMVGSPAIDAADPGATQTLDFDGVVRPQGGGRDMGAFEYKP